MKSCLKIHNNLSVPVLNSTREVESLPKVSTNYCQGLYWSHAAKSNLTNQRPAEYSIYIICCFEALFIDIQETFHFQVAWCYVFIKGMCNVMNIGMYSN